MITYVVSASKLNIIDSCWELYNLHYNRRWSPISKDAPLEKGNIVHPMFKYFYKEKMKGRLYQADQFGIVLDEATNVARREAVEMDLSEKDVDDAIKAARASLLFHQNDGMTVHAVEEPFSKTLYEVADKEGPNGEKIHGVRIIYEGVTDLVATLPNNPLSVWDHKSEGRKSTPSELDNQFQGMAWAFNVETVIVNKVGFQTSLEEKEKFRRIFLNYRHRAILEEWRTDAIKSVLEAIERHKREHIGQGDWPRNRTSCNKYSGCTFRQVCKARPDLRIVKLQTWFKQRPEHEIYQQDHIRTEQQLGDITGVTEQ